MATVAVLPDARTLRVPVRMTEAAHAADLARDIMDDAIGALVQQTAQKTTSPGRRDELLEAVRLYRLAKRHMLNARNHIAAGVTA